VSGSGSDGGFSPRVVLGLVLFGGFAFIAFLWMIGSGMADREPNATGAHVAGKGLNGFAALSAYMDKRGWNVSQARSLGALKQPGVLVLTPLHWSDPAEIEAAVNLHRQAGPTVVIMPKWLAATLPRRTVKVKEGWVKLMRADVPEWPGFHDEIGIGIKPMAGGGWSGGGLPGTLPRPSEVVSGEVIDQEAEDAWPLVPLVVGEADGRMLAGYVDDANDHFELEDIAAGEVPEWDDEVTGDGSYPLIFVFEPDLLNNYGFSQKSNALLAEVLLRAADSEQEKKLIFDLTLPGYARSNNLLTLAFTPPFLAATLCLLLAAAVLLWRALNRFGPPLAAGRSIAFGKRALVANAAGLVRRARRLHLVGPPYADAARERLVRALALPHRLDPAQAEAAIDRALDARAPEAEPFSAASAAMRAARRPVDLLRAAQTLHTLERILTR
jgi:hypothetical protein